MAALAEGVSRMEARRLIAAGVVFIGGRRTRISSRLVRVGEEIRWEPPAPARDEDAGGLHGEPRIVVDRPDLWIIDKPAGMPVEPTRAGDGGTLAAWLRRNHAASFITHRLDAATSGLIVVARDREAQARLNRLFAAHAIGRRYLAVVSPCPDWADAIFDTPLDGRKAVTRAAVVARSSPAGAVVVDLETGRTRQIRRHLGQAGYPVVGETAAGARTKARLLLHAFSLSIPAVDGFAPVAATAPPPLDFTAPAALLGLSLPPDSWGAFVLKGPDRTKTQLACRDSLGPGAQRSWNFLSVGCDDDLYQRGA